MNTTEEPEPSRPESGWAVTPRRDAGRLELSFAGDLDLHAATHVDVDTVLADTDITEVIIDLSAVTFIDSTGVGLVLRLSQRAREIGATPTITSWPQHVGLFGDPPLAPLWRAMGTDGPA